MKRVRDFIPTHEVLLRLFDKSINDSFTLQNTIITVPTFALWFKSSVRSGIAVNFSPLKL